ncbi:Cys-tRNA(Pro) deacylase [Arcanobacterium hippocoleae]
MAKKKKHDGDGAGQGATPALQVLNNLGIPYELIEYEHSDTMDQGFALDTAGVLGVDPHTVFKTLMVETDSGKAAVGVVPASEKLNLKSIAKALGAKSAAMMDPMKAERITGYIRGGISPIGQKRLFPTIIHESALSCDTILVSGGKRSLSLRISAKDLSQAIQGKFANITL